MKGVLKFKRRVGGSTTPMETAETEVSRVSLTLIRDAASAITCMTEKSEIVIGCREFRNKTVNRDIVVSRTAQKAHQGKSEILHHH